jgi:hypothetical protein
MASSIQLTSSCLSQEQHINLPPSLNTRHISLAFVSGCVNSPWAKSKQSSQPMNPHSAMSNAPLRNPRFLAFVNDTETFFSFSRSILEWAFGIQPGQMSMPIAYPLGPAFSAAGKSDDPVPHPTSKTLAPSGIAACSTNLTEK